MAFALGFNDVEVKKTGSTANVPNNPKAKLMYYLHCMCFTLDLSGTSRNLQRLRNYSNYASLSARETNELVMLCRLLNPVLLNDKCIFHSDVVCGNKPNQFFEINAKRTTFAAVQSVMIGSVRANVSKIMCYKMDWLKTYYTEPMKYLLKWGKRSSNGDTKFISLYALTLIICEMTIISTLHCYSANRNEIQWIMLKPNLIKTKSCINRTVNKNLHV